MQEFFKALEQPEYVHVLLNHLPVTALAVSLIVLLVGAAMRQRGTMLLGLVLIVLFAASAYPVLYFGHAGEDRIQSQLYSEGQAWLEHHALLAETWKWLYYATAIVALVGVGLGAWKKKTLWASVPLTVLLTIASLAAGAAIADAGGRIRHREFRIGPPPTEHQDEQGIESESSHEHSRLHVPPDRPYM